MKQSEVWKFMAEIKVRFDADEDWQNIKIWALFCPSEVKSLVKRGLLKPLGQEIPRTVNWYYPSPEAYEKFIKPILLEGELKNE